MAPTTLVINAPAKPVPTKWNKTVAALFTYLRTLLVAVLSAILAVLTTSGHFPLNGTEWRALAWAALVAAIPVIINAINPNDPRYGAGSHLVKYAWADRASIQASPSYAMRFEQARWVSCSLPGGTLQRSMFAIAYA